jgi:hypothetical protein
MKGDGKSSTSIREAGFRRICCWFRRIKSKKLKNAYHSPNKEVSVSTKPNVDPKMKGVPIEVDELEFVKEKAIYDVAAWSRKMESLEDCQFPHKDVSVRKKPDVDSKMKEHSEVALLKKEKVNEVAAVNSQLESCWSNYKKKAIKTQGDYDDKIFEAKMIERETEIERLKAEKENELRALEHTCLTGTSRQTFNVCAQIKTQGNCKCYD